MKVPEGAAAAVVRDDDKALQLKRRGGEGGECVQVTLTTVQPLRQALL